MSTWIPGNQSPTIETARNQVRHEIRDGMPALDPDPIPFEMVRLENLSDQIVSQATPATTIFQVRFQNVPLEQFVTVQVIPNTLVAYIDSWIPTTPSQDVDPNGNFTLPISPVASLQVTYGWQFFADAAIDNFVDQARQWLREYTAITLVPDGLNPALIHYAASLALTALARQVTLSAIKAGTAEIDLSSITTAYQKQASELMDRACQERADYWSRGPEKLAPFIDISSAGGRPWTPIR